jgi:hypothetical protein
MGVKGRVTHSVPLTAMHIQRSGVIPPCSLSPLPLAALTLYHRYYAVPGQTG